MDPEKSRAKDLSNSLVESWRTRLSVNVSYERKKLKRFCSRSDQKYPTIAIPDSFGVRVVVGQDRGSEIRNSIGPVEDGKRSLRWTGQ